MSSPSVKSSLFEVGLAKLEAVKSHDFLWHLRSPWREHFAHDHWWEKSGAEKSQEAWLWEIFRRQPETLNYYIQLRAEIGGHPRTERTAHVSGVPAASGR
jgi:hypothetical protein